MGCQNAVCYISNIPIISGDKCLCITFNDCGSDDDLHVAMRYTEIVDGYERYKETWKSLQYGCDFIRSCDVGTYSDDHKTLLGISVNDDDDLYEDHSMYVHQWVLDIFGLCYCPDGYPNYDTFFCAKLFTISNMLCKDSVSCLLGGQSMSYDQLKSALILSEATTEFLRKRIELCSSIRPDAESNFVSVWDKIKNYKY